ncbi:hypothetical protein MBH78_07880 [Oceanimonas sp. NS1]|nr:hypothetical protein [Oceanimonas sp. NS1]
MKTPVRFVPPTAFELLMMVLSIVSLVAVVLHQFGPFNANEKELLLYLDTGICVILLSHFFMGWPGHPARNASSRCTGLTLSPPFRPLTCCATAEFFRCCGCCACCGSPIRLFATC